MAEQKFQKFGKKFDESKLEHGSFEMPRSAQPLPPGITGKPPIPVGKPMIIQHPDSETKAILEPLGWRPGQPIPDNFGEHLERAKEESLYEINQARITEPAGPLLPPLTVETVKIEDLPKAKQAELRAKLDDATARYQEAVAEAKDAHLAPGVRDILKAKQQIEDPITIDDDRDSWLKEKTAEPPQDEARQKDLPESLKLKHCPKCNHDLKEPSTPAPSEADKQRYWQSVLGGLPFLKSYQIEKVKMELTFRELSPWELDLIVTQVRQDLMARAMTPTEFDWAELLYRYRLALQIRRFATPNKAIQFPESWDAWKTENKYTSLADVAKDVFEEICPTESGGRLLTRYLRNFNDLVGKMEVMVDSPDF